MGFLRFTDVVDFEKDDKSTQGFRLVDFSIPLQQNRYYTNHQSQQSAEEGDGNESECSCEICCSEDINGANSSSEAALLTIYGGSEEKNCCFNKRDPAETVNPEQLLLSHSSNCEGQSAPDN